MRFLSPPSSCRSLGAYASCTVVDGMECLLCFGNEKVERSVKEARNRDGQTPNDKLQLNAPFAKKKDRQDGKTYIAAQTFTFRELAMATRNFKPECLIGEGGFGRVYKGRLRTGQVVAVKQLDRNGIQGSREFLVEILMLSLLHHPNLVNLIGYCADGDQRLLVYEFMPLGSLDDHLHGLQFEREPLGWNTRMKIAAGAARGLEYLHDKASPPIIYRDLKSSNILLDEGYHPKLSDFGLAKIGPVGGNTHVSTRVMGTYGYCAPEYAMTGQLTLKSDVYSFGVVLLELITGRRAIDNARPAGEHNLVAWAHPLFKDHRKFASMADPLLQGRFPMRALFQALAVAAMCLQEQATSRPLIAEVVNALTFLASQLYDPTIHLVHSSRLAQSTTSRDGREKDTTPVGCSNEEGQNVQSNELRGTQCPLLHTPVVPVCNKDLCFRPVISVVNVDNNLAGCFPGRQDADDCNKVGQRNKHEEANRIRTDEQSFSIC